MASIFLSYAREDMPKAKALAKSLERAGHSVWWDRHLRGGSEFAGEIEGALKQSDVVLVLWSQTSVRSAWVRDEAADGRDSGRLLPVMLDDCVPPLGFRQIHSISLAGWSGRGNPPNFADIATAIDGRAEVERGLPGPPAPPARKVPRLLLAGLAALVLVVSAIGAWSFLAKRSEASVPVLAVLPFSDLSPERDKAYFAEGVAEAILTVLAKERGIRVIGRSTAEQLHKAGADAERMRRALGVTHVLEGSARSAGDQLRMSVRLIDASDGQQLWAEEYQRRLDNVFAVQDEIGRAVAQRLKGSFAGAADAAQQLTSADAYALYLAARAKMKDRRSSSLNEALRLAQRVIAADPNYAPGHAIFAELVSLLSEDSYGTIPRARARASAEAHARKSIQLAPRAADGYAAFGLIKAGDAEAVEPLRKAAALDPARSDVRHWLAQTYFSLGRHGEALEQLQGVMEIDPLWGTGVSLYAYSLAASERYDQAEAVLSRFEQRGGSPGVATKIRGDIANYRGDYSEAIRLIHLALKKDPETPLGAQSLMSFYFVVGLPERSPAAAGGVPLLMRLFFTANDQRMAQEIAKSGAKLWDTPGGSLAVEWLGFRRDWRAIEALYDDYPHGVRRFCDEHADSWATIVFAKALDVAGRRAESRQVLACVKDMLRRESRGAVRSPYWPAGQLDLKRSLVHALEGRPDQAFALLKRAISRGARTPFGRGLSEFPVFDPHRASPEYRRLDAQLKQLIARERAEVLRAKDIRA